MIKNKKSKKYILLLFFFSLFSLFLKINTQDIVPIKIGQVIKGEMPLDESHKYYSLTIPKNESNRLLIITTHEDSSINIDTKSSFSDPDFYISKRNKFPSSRRSSEWFSEQYGGDVLSIPAESVEENDVFYIGMYCQFKCRYFLKIETGLESELKLEKYNFLSLKSHETMNYKFKVKNEYEKLKVVAYSVTSSKFKIFMNQNSPSSANTYKVIPSWDNGYVIVIRKGMKEYCSNCEYHIIIHNEENEERSEINQIVLFIDIEEKDLVRNLNNFQIIYDALEMYSKSCFTFNITEKQKNNEKLILDLIVFSGDATLLIEGWKSKNIHRKIEADRYNYSYNILMEKHIILDKKDFDIFDRDEEYYKNKDSILHLCLYSQRQVSYIFQAYFLSSYDKVYHSSILNQGNKLRGYLLKDQVINYELLIDHFSKSKYNIETNITVSSNDILGKTSLYGYYCKEEICNLTSKKDIEQLKKKNELIIPQTYTNPNISVFNIFHSDNYCMKNPKIKLSNGNMIDCSLYAIIKCDEPSEETGLCTFDIQLSIIDTELLMKPKQVYYGSLSIGKTDKYKIIISDENIKSLFVVLNSESGDAQLSVYEEKVTSYNKESLVSISSHKDYIPDVVKVTPKKLGRENIIGKYIIKVYPETFSTYKIYYYVIYKDDDNENQSKKLPEVTMNLNIGQLLMDYFPNDIRYKIYSFTPLIDKKRTIKIFLNRVNINFNIYVYDDISKFEILQLYELRSHPSYEPIKGYQWKSNTNNEVIISKDDINFSLDKMLYIVIAPKDNFFSKFGVNNLNSDNININNNTDKIDHKLVSQYYIGIISENIPITLTEGMPHTMTLSNTYSQQIYHRIHTDLKKDLEILLDVLLGQIDIFASTQYFKVEDIKNLDINSAEYNSQTGYYTSKKFIFKLNLLSYSVLRLSAEYINNNTNIVNTHSPNAHIYYYIRRSESMISERKICQYVLTEKTSETKGQILQPGVVTAGSLKVGNKAYFIIEEIEKRKSAYINVNFKKGSGNLYLGIPNINEKNNKLRFPDEGYYDYKASSFYSSKIIRIPEKEFNKLDQNIKLQFLVTITAETGSYENYNDNSNSNKYTNEVQYYISYSNEPKRINQNKPYDGFIMEGEYKYFNFYFDKSTENIYIGLTNMNGDADMYLNRGNELPTIEKNDWKSTDNIHEYIDISQDDEYFKKNNKTISGYYTLLLVGFIDTSFSLFISSHKNKVFPLRDNIPMTCWCEKKGERCYFRYNEVFDKNNKENGIDHNEIIFTSEYLYGSGFMYSKIYIDKELHNSNEFYKNFPNKNNYDYSNKESNQRNFMKIKVSGDKYTKDTSVLLTFECSEKTKVDISSTSLKHFSTVDYIQDNRENIYYLGINDNNKKQSQLTLILNNYLGKNQDLVYSVHSFIGDAHFKVYANSSLYDEKTQKITFNYKLLNEFDLITNDKGQENNIEIYNPYKHEYHNYIPKSKKANYDDIYFYVEPKTEFGFYITCLFDQNWNKVLIEKSQNFYVVNQQFYGYFDINEEYNDIEFTLSVENNLRMYADLFIKINIIDKTKVTQIQKNEEKKRDEFSLYHYSLPSPENYDYTCTTDKTLGKISLNLNRLPKLTDEELQTGKKFIRGLFYVRLGRTNFEPIPEDIQIDENNNIRRHSNPETQEEIEGGYSRSMINIVITPGIGYFKYIEVKPYEYYFSNLTYNSPYVKQQVETKVYSLTVENPNHDMLIIEISSCVGQYQINIQEQLITKENLNKDSIKYNEMNYKGKKVIYIENIKSKQYYLSVRSQRNKIFCKRLRLSPEECGNNLSYLFYYYTAYSEHYSFQNVDKWIIHSPYGEGKIKLSLPIAITNDLESNEKEISDYRFDVFATKDIDYTTKMGSICYLSRIIPNMTKIFKIDNLVVENKTSLILKDLEPGNKYYINILAQNIKTKELIAFHPFEVIAGRKRMRFWKSFNFVIILGLIIFLIYYIYKYLKTKDELIFLKGDAVPKTEYEMSSYGYNSKNVQYSGLGSNY